MFKGFLLFMILLRIFNIVIGEDETATIELEQGEYINEHGVKVRKVSEWIEGQRQKKRRRMAFYDNLKTETHNKPETGSDSNKRIKELEDENNIMSETDSDSNKRIKELENLLKNNLQMSILNDKIDKLIAISSRTAQILPGCTDNIFGGKNCYNTEALKTLSFDEFVQDFYFSLQQWKDNTKMPSFWIKFPIELIKKNVNENYLAVCLQQGFEIYQATITYVIVFGWLNAIREGKHFTKGREEPMSHLRPPYTYVHVRSYIIGKSIKEGDDKLYIALIQEGLGPMNPDNIQKIREKNELTKLNATKDKDDINHIGWKVPGGLCEYGNSIYQTAKREVKEETDFDINKLEIAGVLWIRHWLTHEYSTSTLNNDNVADISFGVLLKYNKKIEGKIIDEDKKAETAFEIKQGRWWTVERFFDMDEPFVGNQVEDRNALQKSFEWLYERDGPLQDRTDWMHSGLIARHDVTDPYNDANVFKKEQMYPNKNQQKISLYTMDDREPQSKQTALDDRF